MKTRWWAVVMMVLCTALTSVAQIFYKIGAGKLVFDFIQIITNYYLLIGLVLYGMGAVLMILAFKGGDVSVLYPIIATSYIWVGLMSWVFFNEHIGFLKAFGIITIVIGIVFLNIGSKNHEPAIEFTEGV